MLAFRGEDDSLFDDDDQRRRTDASVVNRPQHNSSGVLRNRLASFFLTHTGPELMRSKTATDQLRDNSLLLQERRSIGAASIGTIGGPDEE